jgi:hypothetical protein
MIELIDFIEVFSHSCDDWKTKKENIKSSIEPFNFYRTELLNFKTDRYRNNKSYIKKFSEIFSKELEIFAKEYKLSEIKITDIWCSTYEIGDYQMIHNHGSKGFTGILYIDYDRNFHTPTYFLSPLMDPVSDKTNIIHFDSSEGDLIILPSYLLHFTKPNTSDILRTTLSFDMLVER